MTVSAALLTSDTTDTLASSWNTASVSPQNESLVIVVAAYYDAAATFDSIGVSGLGQTWFSLSTQGYTSQLGLVSAAYCITSSPTPGAITINAGNTYDAISWIVIEFSGNAGEKFGFVQTQGFGGDTNRSTADTFTPTVPLAALGERNVTIGFSGAFNTASEALTFSNTTGWTVAGQKTGNAGVSREIACALYYAIDTTDTTVTSTVDANSDRHFVGMAEFQYELYRPKIMSVVQN
jgi:hypothetical protein